MRSHVNDVYYQRNYIDRREGHVPAFASADGGSQCASLGSNGFLGVCARYQGTSSMLGLSWQCWSLVSNADEKDCSAFDVLYSLLGSHFPAIGSHRVHPNAPLTMANLHALTLAPGHRNCP